MSEQIHLLDAEKKFNCFPHQELQQQFNSDVKLQLEQETSAPFTFFAAIYYYFNSILLLVATSAV